MTKIAVIGSGVVGETLANGFLKHGYNVMRGSREPEKLAAWLKGAGPKASTGTFAAAARFGDDRDPGGQGHGGRVCRRPCEGAPRQQAGHGHDQPDRELAPRGRRRAFLHGAERVAARASAGQGARGSLRQGVLLRRQRVHGRPRLRRHQAHDVHLRQRRVGQGAGRRRCSTQIGWETEDMGGAMPRARSSRFACCGASPGCSTTGGRTRSSCSSSPSRQSAQSAAGGSGGSAPRS